MTRQALICVLAIILTNLNVSAQINEVAAPYSVTYNTEGISEFISLPQFDNIKMAQEDAEIQSRLKIRRFAKMFQVAYSPENSGTWTETESGRVWRLGIHSTGAYSIYLVFGKFRLNNGVKLFVYNKEKSDFAGAFTNRNNNNANVLTIAPIAGESIIIELNIPSGVYDFGELSLAQVGHDYVNEFGGKLKSGIYGTSESCNIDINCPQGAAWQTEKNAVCRLLINGALCTGTLINNIAGKKIPYLITACHCVGDSMDASNTLFFFGYERTGCKAYNTEKALSLSGASLMATTARQLDFSLLKLNLYPPASYNPYFVGFDADSITPQGGACIHHPNGDVKKVSGYSRPLTSGDFGEGFDQYSHWLVARWDFGSTQGGSSGSPFFNTSHKLCGTLSGGDATCKKPINDFFLKMHRAWAGYPDTSKQLKHWLDPDNTGKTKAEGIYPYGQPQSQGNVYTNAKGEFVTTYKDRLLNGTISGHNSSHFHYFAEKFYAPKPIRLSGMYLHVESYFIGEMFSTVTLKVWDQLKPMKEKYTQDVYLRSFIQPAANYIYFDSLVTVSDTFYVGYYLNYMFYDSLTVYTAVNRGIGGSSTMYVNNGAWHNINEITNPVINTALAIGIISPNGIDPTFKVRRTYNMVPNPCSDYLIIEFSDEISPVTFECYNITGRRFALDYSKVDLGYRLNTTILPQGLYFLVIHTKTQKITERFVVIKSNL